MAIEILLITVIFIIAAIVLFVKKQNKKAAVFVGFAAFNSLFAVYINYLSNL